MKIEIAKDAGYCFGVRDAVNLAYDAAEKYGEVYMLGDIVHNERVVEDLSESIKEIKKQRESFGVHDSPGSAKDASDFLKNYKREKK